MKFRWVPWGDGSTPQLMNGLRNDNGDDVILGGDGWVEVDLEYAPLLAAAPDLLTLLRAVTPIAREYFEFERGRIEQSLHSPEAVAIINAQNFLMRFPEGK